MRMDNGVDLEAWRELRMNATQDGSIIRRTSLG